MPKKYVVRLTPEERERLQDLVSKGKTQAYRIRHAHVLLKADAEGPGLAGSADHGGLFVQSVYG